MTFSMGILKVKMRGHLSFDGNFSSTPHWISNWIQLQWFWHLWVLQRATNRQHGMYRSFLTGVENFQFQKASKNFNRIQSFLLFAILDSTLFKIRVWKTQFLMTDDCHVYSSGSQIQMLTEFGIVECKHYTSQKRRVSKYLLCR